MAPPRAYEWLETEINEWKTPASMCVSSGLAFEIGYQRNRRLFALAGGNSALLNHYELSANGFDDLIHLCGGTDQSKHYRSAPKYCIGVARP